MRTDYRASFLVSLFTYLIWPFGSLLIAFKRLDKFSFYIFILVGFFYGYTYNYIGESDMPRYANEFTRISTWSFERLLFEFSSGNYSDFYTITLSYIVSRFTTDLKLYIAFATLIYSLFYFKSIHIIFNLVPKNKSILCHLLLFSIFFYIPIFYVNGLRFYTSFYVFIYAILNIFIKKDIRYYIIAFVTPLIHISFLIPAFLLILFKFIGNYRIICLLILFATFFTPSSVSFSEFTSNEANQKKINAYTTTKGIEGLEGRFESYHANSSFKFIMYKFFLSSHYYISAVLFVLILIISDLRNLFDHFSPKIINFNIIFLALANFMNHYAEGERFNHLFVLIFLGSITIIYSLKKKANLNVIAWILTISLFPFIASTTYVYIATCSVEFFTTNWIYALFFM